jgi:hypothetical protein
MVQYDNLTRWHTVSRAIDGRVDESEGRAEISKY